MSALLLFTGSAMLFQSVLKIQSFIDRVDDNLPPLVVEIIAAKKDVQDKTDKIAAGVSVFTFFFESPNSALTMGGVQCIYNKTYYRILSLFRYLG